MYGDGAEAIVLLSNLISLFLVGFIPGVYFSGLFFLKARMHPLLALLLSLFVGLISSVVGAVALFILGAYLYSFDKSFNRVLGLIIVLSIPLEIVFIPVHFFFFRKRKKIAKLASAKR